MKKIKILFISLKYDYGDPSRGLGFFYTNHFSVLTQMPQVDVEFFGMDDAIVVSKRRDLNQNLLTKVKSFSPDLCFFCLHEDEIFPETIKAISAQTITLNWFADDHWRLDNYSRFYAPLFTWVTTTYSKAINKYRCYGINNVLHTQWAADTGTYKVVTSVRDIDVSFVGSWTKNRQRVFEYLKRAGINVQFWGQGWPNGRLSQENMIKVFSRSKISLGLNTPSSYVGIKPLVGIFFRRRGRYGFKSDFINIWSNLRQWWQKRIPMIKARMFEIPACGALLFTQLADNISDYYIDGKEIILYKNEADLVGKIKYYLANSSKLKLISDAGFLRTINDHTYQVRFLEIFKSLGLI